MEDVVIELLASSFCQAFGLSIIGHQHERSEGLSHEELLQHSDHVADAAEIADTSVAKLRPRLVVAVEVGREAVARC